MNASPVGAHESLTLDEAMRSTRSWLCLVGPRASGKSVLAASLRAGATAIDASWSLAPLFRAATGGIEVRVPGRAFVVAPGAKAAAPDAEWPSRPTPSADLVLSRPHIDRSAPATFDPVLLDVPGSWAVRDTGRRHGILQRVLADSQRFALVVPFWALLPRAFLEERALALLGETIWATSMAAGPIDAPDPELLRRAVEAVELELRAWIDALLSRVGSAVDVLVLLSQFQPDVVATLFDGVAPGLGTTLVERYDALLRPEPPRVITLGRLTSHLHAVDAVGRGLMDQVARVSPTSATSADPTVLGQLRRICGQGMGNLHAQRHALGRVRSCTILPLNVVRIAGAGKYEWFVHGRAAGLEDSRMCADVLWWSLLQLHAWELWRA